MREIGQKKFSLEILDIEKINFWFCILNVPDVRLLFIISE